jgi:hypothetical protein
MAMEPKRPAATPAMAKQAQKAARPLPEMGGPEAMGGAAAAAADELEFEARDLLRDHPVRGPLHDDIEQTRARPVRVESG